MICLGADAACRLPVNVFHFAWPGSWSSELVGGWYENQVVTITIAQAAANNGQAFVFGGLVEETAS
jgi:hypothetical protein